MQVKGSTFLLWTLECFPSLSRLVDEAMSIEVSYKKHTHIEQANIKGDVQFKIYNNNKQLTQKKWNFLSPIFQGKVYAELLCWNPNLKWKLRHYRAVNRALKGWGEGNNLAICTLSVEIQEERYYSITQIYPQLSRDWGMDGSGSKESNFSNITAQDTNSVLNINPLHDHHDIFLMTADITWAPALRTPGPGLSAGSLCCCGPWIPEMSMRLLRYYELFCF